MGFLQTGNSFPVFSRDTPCKIGALSRIKYNLAGSVNAKEIS